MALVAAVGTDTYGGLSGFKRPNPGNPTRIPGNLPAFRGVVNKPGSAIKTPAIKSSTNHPDRKTNVQIPYARVVPVEGHAKVGRLAPGDVAFVSKTRPGVPGYAHSRETQLLGVDALNSFMGPDWWDMKVDANTYRYLLVDSNKPADDWRSVPSLQEWTLDGIVLSNEAKEVFYGGGGERDGQLYNIAIQGPTMVNNGFVEEHQSWDEVARIQQGQQNQASSVFAPGYMDHRVEKFGPHSSVSVKQSWDFAADYKGPKYHLYPMQMFDRDVRPMHELYVGLVCTEYKFGEDENQSMTDLATAETALTNAEAALVTAYDTGEGANAIDYFEELEKAKAGVLDAKRDLSKLKQGKEVHLAARAKTAFSKMGWWNDDDGKPTDTAPKKFCAFRYVLFTSSQAWDLDLDDATAPWKGIEMMAPIDEPVLRTKKKQRLGRDPYDDDGQRKEDFRHMVGAWHIGKVLDMKAGKMPWFEGGPADTGFRVTANVNISWHDWRALRREYTPAGSPVQIGDKLTGSGGWDIAEPNRQFPDSLKIFQWPTAFDNALMQKPTGTKDDVAKSYRNNTQVPINPDAFYKGNPYETDERAAYLEPRHFDETDELKQLQEETSTDLSKFEDEAGFEAISAAIRKARALQRVVVPPHVPNGTVQQHLHRARTAITNLKLRTAPITEEEIAAHRAGQALPQMAHFVMAPSAPSVAADTPATAPAAASAGAAVRRRAGNTPDPSLNHAGLVGGPQNEGPLIGAPSAPSATQGANTASALPPIIEAPSAPPQPAGSKRGRRTAESDDVFSTIFGGTAPEASTPMQPLNPAHRPEGASGRSFARRGKGKDKE